jgi:hypothetical protein
VHCSGVLLAAGAGWPGDLELGPGPPQPLQQQGHGHALRTTQCARCRVLSNASMPNVECDNALNAQAVAGCDSQVPVYGDTRVCRFPGGGGGSLMSSCANREARGGNFTPPSPTWVQWVAGLGWRWSKGSDLVIDLVTGPLGSAVQ